MVVSQIEDHGKVTNNGMVVSQIEDHGKVTNNGIMAEMVNWSELSYRYWHNGLNGKLEGVKWPIIAWWLKIINWHMLFTNAGMSDWNGKMAWVEWPMMESYQRQMMKFVNVLKPEMAQRMREERQSIQFRLYF